MEVRLNKLLLIAPLFFGYYKEMIKESELMGYEVDYICDAPSNSNISKAVARINKGLIGYSTKKYFENTVLQEIKRKKYDFVLVVAGMTFAFTPDMIEIIRNYNPKAKFIMYQWDSERNIPYVINIHRFFDEVYTFDRVDCVSRPIYKFLPLFYIRTYENIGDRKKKEFIYDCSYIGTAHPKKFKTINEMAEALKELMPNQYIYHYMPSVLKFTYHKLTSPEYKRAKLKDFKMEKMSASEMTNIFEASKCILDSPQAGQNGLTIRTIECLGAKRKLITNNVDVKNYDFYCEENILVFDGDLDFNSVFFKEAYVELPREIYKKYSLRAWIATMLK